MNTERRKYVRFLVKDDSFAALRNGFRKVGKIHDISVKGMAFSYLSETTQVNSADYHTEIDIFGLKNEFRLSNVPCRIVYEIQDATPDEGFLVRMFKCGLHFGELSNMQRELLNSFIKKYAIKKWPTEEMPGMSNSHVELT